MSATIKRRVVGPPWGKLGPALSKKKNYSGPIMLKVPKVTNAVRPPWGKLGPGAALTPGQINYPAIIVQTCVNLSKQNFTLNLPKINSLSSKLAFNQSHKINPICTLPVSNLHRFVGGSCLCVYIYLVVVLLCGCY